MPSPSTRAAGGLSLVAALVHAGLAPEHFALWWGYGLFFATAAALQAVLALALLLDAFGGRAEARVLALGLAGTLALLAVYVVSRTVGFGFLDPSLAGTEPIGAIDLVAKAAEFGVAILIGHRFIAARRAA